MSDIPTPASPPAWRSYIHLYLPLLVSFILVFCGTSISQTLGFSRFDGGNTLPLVLLSAFPTYLLASLFYPHDRHAPPPTQQLRFTRKNPLYRALVLVTYGRIFGTPFNFIFYLADLLCSFVAGSLIGERPLGTPQRQSEFVAVLPWLLGSAVVTRICSLTSNPILLILAGSVDRTLWRSAYIALVDDIVGKLAQPNVHTIKGKIGLIALQAFTITSLTFLGLAWLKRLLAANAVDPSPEA